MFMLEHPRPNVDWPYFMILAEEKPKRGWYLCTTEFALDDLSDDKLAALCQKTIQAVRDLADRRGLTAEQIEPVPEEEEVHEDFDRVLPFSSAMNAT